MVVGVVVVAAAAAASVAADVAAAPLLFLRLELDGEACAVVV